MNRIAVFPYDDNFYPFLKYSPNMIGFEISKVFSIRGWGYVGEKIFDVLDTTSRNILVEDISEKMNVEEFDIFLLAEPEHYIDENYIVQIIDRMAQMNKIIWIFKRMSDELIAKINTICEHNNVKVQFFSREIEDEDFDGEEILYDISTPIITVAGMGEKTNKMELQINLAISLQKDKYKVVWVSSRNEAVLYNGQTFPAFMYADGVSEKKKILMYNHYLKWIEQSEKPDVILIGIPGGIMPDSKKQVGYFGITSYEILNAVNPDYFILSLYGNSLGKNYLDELRNVMKYKFNVEVDSFYVGNTEQDAYSLDKLTPIEYIHLGQLVVDKRVKEVDYAEIPVYTCSNVSQLYQSMIEKLGEYDDFQSL
ncbi:MAG: TIGR04066 family peptide maturation system protein [Lachnospiraceae bacterium]|nr:TIGR04066 family peptide maturation system protein [Lachnospiraceae bacterium]